MSGLKLLHLANHGALNIGNAALIHGLERVLKEDFPVELCFVEEPWDAYTSGRRSLRFDEQFVERVNATDGLLIGAAVAMDGERKYGHTGMRFNLPLPLWQKIERPIIFYGLSHNIWTSRPYNHLDRLRAMLSHVLSSERYLFSVRNDGTKEWLESLIGHSSERILVVPDPAVYVPTLDCIHPELRGDKINVIVSLNREHEHYRWGGTESGNWQRRAQHLGEYLVRTRFKSFAYVPKWKKARDLFLVGLGDVLTRLGAEFNLNIVLCAHTFEDLEMNFELFEMFSPEVRRRCIFMSTLLPMSRGPAFYDLYAKADLAISMRIHSMNPAVGLGTPVIPLITQDRMAAFMSDAGLADLCVDVRQPVSCGRLYDTTRLALKNLGTIRCRLLKARAEFRERTSSFNGRVAAILGLR